MTFFTRIILGNLRVRLAGAAKQTGHKNKGTMTSRYKQFRPCKVDENQSEIVDVFRKLGCMVECLHAVGHGVFDLIVAIDFINVFVEVKNYKNAPSDRRYTPEQKKWNFSWTGLRGVVTTKHEAQELVRKCRAFVAQVHEEIDVPFIGCNEFQYRPSLF